MDDWKKILPMLLIVVVPVLFLGALLLNKSTALVQNQQSEIEKLSKSPSSVANTPQKDNNLLGASAQKVDPKTMTTPPQMQIDQNKTYTATLKTSAGDIIISLNAKQTPTTVNNFVFLAKNNFYDNTVFHRVIKGFMIQGGDPKGDGAGGPGYKFNDEPFTGEYTRGTVAMANSGPNTNGSQFFIMHQDYALPQNYVIFGKVTQGLEVVDKIADAPTQPGGEGSKPVNPVKVTSVAIGEN